MADRDDMTRQLIERLHAMESDELQQRLRRGHFAEHAVELARGELIRRGLTPERAVLVEEEPTGDSQDMVIIERRLNPVEANILQSALSAGGVPAIVDDANAAHCLGYLAYALDGVRVRVPESHAARAREIIDDIAANRCMLEGGDAEEVSGEPDVQYQRVLAYTQDEGLARKWRTATPRMPGFMWSALLFGSIWFFYRKLYRTGAILFIIESLLLFSIAAAGRAERIYLLAFMAMRILIACTAEGLYYARTRTIILREAATHADESVLRQALQQCGGVSFPLALGALLAHRLLTYAF
ncbi:MAG TPA: DUF2628 domain-containing protein [Rhodocyclaceae bacterium]|nr:DUF2628 domain-containing protein [Rhodocyclaceae bacterium]